MKIQANMTTYHFSENTKVAQGKRTKKPLRNIEANWRNTYSVSAKSEAWQGMLSVINTMFP